MLNVNRAARTIDGRAVPYGVVGQAPVQLPRRFSFGSLFWNELPPLLLEHNQSLRVGKAFALQDLSFGMWASFKVRNGPKGDRALEMATTTHRGLSVGIDLDTAKSWIATDGVLEYTSARLVEISLTSSPVFS